jgi:ankyrin repeat protein
MLMKADDAEIAGLLIERGADVNARDNTLWTALMFTGNLGKARLLIERGADVNAKSHL